MSFFLRFAYFKILYFLIPILLILALYRWKYYKSTTYRHTLGSYFKKRKLNASPFYKKFFFWMRATILLILIFLIAKPQFVDSKSKVTVEGIDIVLVLDVSESMKLFDDIDDRRQRIEVAKDEAIRFVNKRDNDAIGVVIFGYYALTKCPLTLDKKILNEILKDIQIGEADGRATCIARSIATAANRLKNSAAQSKIIILLTDGAPTVELDLPMNSTIEIAKELGIKIYTIGVGGDHGGLFDHPSFGIVPAQIQLNKQLLEDIARKTGGQFFHAKNPLDMKNIYNTIDTLEKTKIETNIFNKYYDFFIPLIFLVIFMFFCEQFFATYIWFYL